MLDRFMQRFAAWFASTRGVMQTFVITTAVGVIEQIMPNIDPQHFFYMYLMTYYSTITQSALAYASAESARSSEKTLQHLESLSLDMKHLMKNQSDMLKTILILAEREAEIEKAHNAHVAAVKHHKKE